MSLLYKGGMFPDREQALETLFQGVTAEDLREYRRIHGVDPLGFPLPSGADLDAAVAKAHEEEKARRATAGE